MPRDLSKKIYPFGPWKTLLGPFSSFSPRVHLGVNLDNVKFQEGPLNLSKVPKWPITCSIIFRSVREYVFCRKGRHSLRES